MGGVEVAGDGADSRSIHALHTILADRFDKYFSSYIEARRLIIYVHDCAWYIGAELGELAETFELPFFTSRRKLQEFLAAGHS